MISTGTPAVVRSHISDPDKPDCWLLSPDAWLPCLRLFFSLPLPVSHFWSSFLASESPRRDALYFSDLWRAGHNFSVCANPDLFFKKKQRGLHIIILIYNVFLIVFNN